MVGVCVYVSSLGIAKTSAKQPTNLPCSVAGLIHARKQRFAVKANRNCSDSCFGLGAMLVGCGAILGCSLAPEWEKIHRSSDHKMKY